jgi:hypothetical protein
MPSSPYPLLPDQNETGDGPSGPDIIVRYPAGPMGPTGPTGPAGVAGSMLFLQQGEPIPTGFVGLIARPAV